MSELAQFGSGLAPRDSRRLGRELSRLESQGRFEIARIDQQAELQAERVSAVAYVGKRGLHEVAMLSQTEVQLSALLPAAANRLHAIGDMTALGMAEVVSDTVRKVR